MNEQNRVKWRHGITVAVILLILGISYTAWSSEAPRISIQELKTMMDKGDPVIVVDVQPKDIYEAEHIKAAISLPYKSPMELEDVMILPEDRLIVVYCDCGPGEADSSDMAAQLKNFGYENVKVLKDPSIRGWRAAGYPLEKSK